MVKICVAFVDVMLQLTVINPTSIDTLFAVSYDPVALYSLMLCSQCKLESVYKIFESSVSISYYWLFKVKPLI